MGLDKLNFLYRQIILENANNPQNRGKLAKADFQTTVYNPNCGDRLTVFLNLDEREHISEIKFDGVGCTISQASASLMIQLVKGKSKKEAISLAKIFSDIAAGKKRGEEEIAKLKDAQVLTNIMEFPARIKCATLAWWALDRILLGEDKTE